MNLFVAVGQGSIHEPCLINLTYKGNPGAEQVIALVGKGLTFDTGGYNVKPVDSMKGMFLDKHGAASMLAAFRAVCQLGLKVNLTCSLGMAENCISGKAYKTTDIFTSRKGLTVEIGHTDAEGRLVLADTMTWTQQQHRVSTLLEMSTLTGAVIIALGNTTGGLFANCDKLAAELVKAGEQVEEGLYRLPILKEHRDIIKPAKADLTNSPGKPAGASSQAAAFLERFVEPGVAWAHLDIAGTAGKDQATGFGANTVLEWVKAQA
jgi:leucyl aminopeptidase